MRLFSRKPEKTGVELIQEKSRNILGVFTKTVEELKEVNAEIIEASRERSEIIKQLQAEMITLEIEREKNSRVTSKIENILE